MTLMNEWEEAALDQGIERGLTPFLRILRRTVGSLPADTEEQIRKLSVSQLEQLADASGTFSSVADLQAWLAEHRSP